MMFSKWIRYEDLMHLGQKELVPGTMQYKRNFMRDATHRSVLDIELMLDIDDKVNPEDPERPFASIWKKAIHVYNEIRRRNQLIKPVMSFTGSKSYHLSIIMPQLRDCKAQQRNRLKSALLGLYGADLQKKADRCMISMEGEMHYKSGKKKYEVLA
jgi:hypothetical protein